VIINFKTSIEWYIFPFYFLPNSSCDNLAT